MHPTPNDNYRRIKNPIGETDIRKSRPPRTRRKPSFNAALVAPKSAPLPRKVFPQVGPLGPNFDLYASTMDLRSPPRFEAPPPPPVSQVVGGERMLKNQIYASRNSVYNSTNNLEYSEYGELRAIVRRIEEQKSNTLSSRNNNYVARHQSFSTGKSPHLNRKRMYFDYVPSSVMRSHSHHGGNNQGPLLASRPNNLGGPAPSQTLPHTTGPPINMNNNRSPRHQIQHPDQYSPDRVGSSHPFLRGGQETHDYPGQSPNAGTLINSRLDSSGVSSSPSSSMDNRKGRRNSNKSSSSLLIKRSEDAPVTLKGWLYKQGSDGLMLWKKRWFVLTEYCLFYYRSPDEDKVSGSILLPSYKISPVPKENTMFRKYSFKAEHQNMRTYYFATDTKEAMIQWMNALSLASIMQTPAHLQASLSNVNGNNSQTRSSVAVMNNLRSPIPHHQYPTQVHQMFSPNGNAYQYPHHQSGDQIDAGENGRQPLYANAPPKPRRLTNTREDSPDRFEDEELSPAYHQQMYSRQIPSKVPTRSHTPGERMMYPQPQHYPYQQATHVQNLQQRPGEAVNNGNPPPPVHVRNRLPQERRTPEAYGRGQFNLVAQTYEDVLRNKPNPGFPPPQGRNYPPPPPPVPNPHPQFQGYQGANPLPVPQPPYYPPPAQALPQHVPRGQAVTPGQPQGRAPRPHSADFLEFDRGVVPVPAQSSGAITNPQAPQPSQGNPLRRKQHQQPPRPKSSVDPRMFDSSWSSELYAEQMRNHASTYAMGSTAQQAPRSQSRASVHSKSQMFHDSSTQATSAHPIRTPQHRLYPPQTSQNSDSQVDSSEEVSRYFPTPSPRKPVPGTTYQNLPDNSAAVHRQYPQYQARLETVTPNRLSEQHHGNNGSDNGTSEFKRSASARLHRTKKNYPEIFNQSDVGPEDSKKKEQREESMKRLLEWKQRMLQSPLTRKSSRNASCTQTPTNSNSPVPSMGQDFQFRQKVLEELERQSGKSSSTPNNSVISSGDRRLSRKGSGASRSSRSRSSPRIANRPNTSSSDEDKSQEASRQSRKKSKPPSEKRSRNPSRESRRSSTHLDMSSSDQPEYINISSLEQAFNSEQSNELQVVKAEWRKRAIGPDDWYSDDFNYDHAKSSFSEDPLMNNQYSHLLDLKYHNQAAGSYVQTTKTEAESPPQPPHKSRSRRTLKEEGRSVTWHADKFRDFQILSKRGGEDTLVEVTGSLKRSSKRVVANEDKIPWSPIQAFEEIQRMKELTPKPLVVKDKVPKMPMAPVELDEASSRRTSTKSSVSQFSLEDIDAALEDDCVFEAEAAKLPEEIEAVELNETKALIEKQRKRREKFFESVLSDSKEEGTTSSDEETGEGSQPKPRERKRSVKELLSDFEKKSKEIQDQDDDEHDELSGSRRRVCSDTETMMFETSSDEVASVEAVKPEDPPQEVFCPEVPPRTPKGPKPRLAQEDQYLPMHPPRTAHVMVAEGQYLPMTPSKSPSKRKPQSGGHDFRPDSMTSSNASRGSSQSIADSRVLMSSELTMGVLTPSELMLQVHSRTPSQSMVIDHLQREFGNKMSLQEQTYVDIMEDQDGMTVPSRDKLPKRPILAPPNAPATRVHKPKESPRYIEIDDPEDQEASSLTNVAHYEYLYKARSATPLHYEVVYQEIPDDEEVQKFTQALPQSPLKKAPGDSKRPIEGLPDIIGNTPTHRGHSSSDQDEDNLSHSRPPSSAHISDSFKPASFFLRSTSQESKLEHSHLSVRELPMTPMERRKSAEDLRRGMDGSMRSSISSLDSAGKRRPTLENIEEVSKGRERRGTAARRRETITILPPQPEVGYQNEEGDQLEHSYLPPISPQNQKDTRTRPQSALEDLEEAPLSLRSPKVPYYVSDLSNSSLNESPSTLAGVTTLDRTKAINQLHMSMELLDAETSKHLAFKSHDDLLQQIRRSAAPTPIPDHARPNPVARSQSLEGLLGDNPGTPRDSVQVQMAPTPTPSSTNLPPRGRAAPPPPPNVPPLDLGTPLPPSRSQPQGPAPWDQMDDEGEDDPLWRESLRRASAKHRARSMDQKSELVRNPREVQNVQRGNDSYYWDEQAQRFFKVVDPNLPSTPVQPNEMPFLDQSLPLLTDSEVLGTGRPMTSEPNQLDLASDIRPPCDSDVNIYENYPTQSTRAHHHLASLAPPSPHQTYENQAQFVEPVAPQRVRLQGQQGRRRTLSTGRKDSDPMKQKERGNLLDITAQDLLGKSHEELVLMLIHLRRQGTGLNEAIESTRAEMQSIVHHPKDTEENQNLLHDLNTHIRELEDQRARAQPVISLVDNMVKLGSLYRGPADAPLSHRIRNLPTSSSSSSGVSSGFEGKNMRKMPFNEDSEKMAEQRKAEVQKTLEDSLERTKKTIPNGSEEFEAFNKEQEMLENELRRVHGQLQTCQKKLDENSSDHSRWEHDLLFLRQQLQQSATRDMQYGINQSAETLAIEGELAQVQQRASELHRERQSLMNEIQMLLHRQEFLRHESQRKPTPSFSHNYENVIPQTLAKVDPVENGTEMELTLGDISEADDRVKKFYGIIPKDNKAAEIKTVRMVKRDSKERKLLEVDEQETPPMLPRGNYGQNMHDFLQNPKDNLNGLANGNDVPKKRGEVYSSGSLPRNYESSSSAESSGNFTNSPAGKAMISQVNGTSIPIPSINGSSTKLTFKLGEYYRKKTKDSNDRPASGLSAHERLFGSSRESSMSPPMSPLKNTALTGSSDSGVSPMMSPIFKSATAKQIIEEVGKTAPSAGLKYRRKSKKRSHTITSGNPAIMEALNKHDSKQGANRSRDDLDMEQILRPKANAPDVIKSALDKKDMKINTATIDNLFGVPDKIYIPERYIPDTDMDNMTSEERQVRLKKADSIRRMLADTGTAPILGGLTPKQKENMDDEKKEREHLLALNQVLARQVMEKSRIVAGRKTSQS